MRTVLTILLASSCFTAQAQFGKGYADLVERVQDAVVHIETIGEARTRESSMLEDFFRFDRREQRSEPQRGAGSGFIISKDGYIVTNRHVVADSKKVKVNLVNEETYDAEVIGIDDSLDVALIKIDARGLTSFKIGDSDAMRIGDVLLAMGYPLELGFSVTTGIVSGIGRNMRTGSMDLGTYIQTDADITFGNSGGPLINAAGEVIGINTMIITRGETFGFAIPSNMFMHSIEQLKRYGEVRRGALGIGLGDLSKEGREYFGLDHGALVTRVYDGFPAKDAGIKQDDVILEINGRKVSNSEDVINAVARKPPGAEVKVTLLSNGKRKTKTFALGDRNDFSTDRPIVSRNNDEANESSLGFSIRPLSRTARLRMGLDRDASGLLVTDVETGGMAEEKGLRPGALITHVNREPVRNVADLEDALGKVAANRPVPVRVMESVGAGEYRERTIFLRKQD